MLFIPTGFEDMGVHQFLNLVFINITNYFLNILYLYFVYFIIYSLPYGNNHP
jgi:hypothetical protein